MSATSAVTDIRIGHINLRVTDLDRAVAFYRDVLGFRVTADAREAGVPMVLLAAGDYHHHVALNNFARAARDDRAAVPARNAAEAHLQSPAPRPARADESDVGLHHVAFLYPDRAALARAVQRVLEVGYPIDSAEDHGANVAVYRCLLFAATRSILGRRPRRTAGRGGLRQNMAGASRRP